MTQVLVHDELLGWLGGDAATPVRSKVWFQLRHLMAHGRATRSKSSVGAARGWLRIPLSDSHWYLWWLRPSSPALAGESLSKDEVLVRAVRHHDATSMGLQPGTREDWHPLTPQDIAALCDPEAEPLSPEQRQVPASTSQVTIVRGGPGAGKSWALLGTIDHHKNALYTTTHRGLVRLADQYLHSIGSGSRAVTVDDLFAELSGAAVAQRLPYREGAERVRRLAVEHGLQIGRLNSVPELLYAELVGTVFGMVDARSSDAELRTIPPSVFRELLADRFDRATHRLLFDLGELCVETQDERGLLGTHRAALAAAHAAQQIGSQALTPNVILVDEVQDLTHTELTALIAWAGRLAQLGTGPRLVLAGDDSQSVQPARFEWSRVLELFDARETNQVILPGQLRSPLEIANVVDRSVSLYVNRIPEDIASLAHAAGPPEGHVVLCRADSDGFDELFAQGSLIPGVAWVSASVTRPASTSPLVLTADEAKGLDWDIVVVPDADEVLEQVAATRFSRGWMRGVADRLAVDCLRVALSRATDLLVLACRDEAGEHRLRTDLAPHAPVVQAAELLERMREVRQGTEGMFSAGTSVESTIEEALRTLDMAPSRARELIRGLLRSPTLLSERMDLTRRAARLAREQFSDPQLSAQLLEASELFVDAARAWRSAGEVDRATRCDQRVDEIRRRGAEELETGGSRSALELYAQHHDLDALVATLRAHHIPDAHAILERHQIDRRAVARRLRTEEAGALAAAEILRDTETLASIGRNALQSWSRDGQFTSHRVVWNRVRQSLPDEVVRATLRYVLSRPKQADTTQLVRYLGRQAADPTLGDLLRDEHPEVAAQVYSLAGDHDAAVELFLAEDRVFDAVRELELGGATDREIARRLVRAGHHLEAADRYLMGGDPARAGQEFARAGDFASAARSFIEAGEPERAAKVLDRLRAKTPRWGQSQVSELAAELGLDRSEVNHPDRNDIPLTTTDAGGGQVGGDRNHPGAGAGLASDRDIAAVVSMWAKRSDPKYSDDERVRFFLETGRRDRAIALCRNSAAVSPELVAEVLHGDASP